MFRANFRTGDVSVCYVLEEKVVCTPQTGPAAEAGAAAPRAPLAPPGPGRPQAPGPGTTRPQ